MRLSLGYQPFTFFSLSLSIACVSWFIASYVSYYQPSLHNLLFPLILLGMSSPSISAFIMFAKSKNKDLWHDFWQKLRIDRIKIRFIPVITLTMPCLILLAITISVLFGFSTEQFSLSNLSSDQALKGINLITMVIIVALSCTLEEIGWRGYGIDSLRSKFNLWYTSLIFAAIWSLWHVPAFFIKNGYFQQELWNLGIIYVLIYFISLFPITFLINWLYIQNNRSILVAILFHTVMNLSYGFFQIQPFTRIILMFLLLTTAGIVLIKDKKVFFTEKLQ